jgi:adenylyltransferase/sulfurtransferase
MSLSREELERYDRQIRIPGFGVEGQLKLKRSSVLVAGLGGLGCTASMYLTAAGVGRVVLVDREAVELSNLNRQVLHWSSDVSRLKVESAAEKLRQLNPTVRVEGTSVEVNEDTVYDLVKGVDVVVDGMDNFKTRFTLNEACVKLNKPFIHAAVYGLEGRLLTILPRRGPCLRCLIPIDPPETRPLPVLGATPALMACLQAMEAVKLITGLGEPLIGRLIIFDGSTSTFYEVAVRRSEGCPVCGEGVKGGSGLKA